jgi:hypothetical protein
MPGCRFPSQHTSTTLRARGRTRGLCMPVHPAEPHVRYPVLSPPNKAIAFLSRTHARPVAGRSGSTGLPVDRAPWGACSGCCGRGPDAHSHSHPPLQCRAHARALDKRRVDGGRQGLTRPQHAGPVSAGARGLGPREGLARVLALVLARVRVCAHAFTWHASSSFVPRAGL